MIDLLFPVQGERIATDHAYPLYASLSRRVRAFHDADARVRFAPITGQSGTPGCLSLTPHSRLRIRLPEDRIREVLPLAGQRLEAGEHAVRLGVPSVSALIPAPTLFARIVTMRHHTTPETFLPRIVQELLKNYIQAEATIPQVATGRFAGQPRRRILRIKTRRIIGFALLVSGLTSEESIRLQENGLGGRTRMGCGFFLPVTEGK